MTIQSEIIQGWEALRQPADVKIIADRAGCTRQNIYNAFRSGKCSEKLFNIMASYYDDRAKNYAALHKTIQSIL
jgi:hypothetical protein